MFNFQVRIALRHSGTPRTVRQGHAEVHGRPHLREVLEGKGQVRVLEGERVGLLQDDGTGLTQNMRL